MNILILSAPGSSLYIIILTYKDGRQAERVKSYHGQCISSSSNYWSTSILKNGARHEINKLMKNTVI